MSIYGYIRTNCFFDTNEQIRALSQYTCDQLFIEDNQLETNCEFKKLLHNLKSGDTLVVYKTQILTRAVSDFDTLLRKLTELNITLICVSEEQVELESLYYYNKLLAEIQENYRSYNLKKRTEEAKEKGILFGRPRIEVEKEEKIKFLFQNKRLPMRQIASMCGVSLGTVHKYVNKGQKE